jgi:hypothetical protein
VQQLLLILTIMLIFMTIAAIWAIAWMLTGGLEPTAPSNYGRPLAASNYGRPVPTVAKPKPTKQIKVERGKVLAFAAKPWYTSQINRRSRESRH